jgi:hypothetical protein
MYSIVPKRQVLRPDIQLRIRAINADKGGDKAELRLQSGGPVLYVGQAIADGSSKINAESITDLRI